jgi:RP/EB family microtubule-associated protein
MKRFWDTNYPGHPYDPVARRRGQSTDTPATLAPIASTRATSVPGAAAGRSGGKTPIGGHRSGSASAVNHEQVLGLQAQLKEMSAHLEGLEKERDFYFAKVRALFLLNEASSCAHSFLSLSCAISRSWCSNRRKNSQKKGARM